VTDYPESSSSDHGVRTSLGRGLDATADPCENADKGASRSPNPGERTTMSEFDSPWKESLEIFLEPFLQFFFPDVHADLDWSRGYESLDKELQQILREGELGQRLADKLFKVWPNDGVELWLLIHVEIQNQPDERFGERMYVYNYRIYDRFRRGVVSLAVLGDERRGWRPRQFVFRRWGFSLRMQFPMVKLLDYRKNIAELESSPNPFAAVVLAHLKTQETRRQPAERCRWKLRLVKGLFERGLTAEGVRQLFRLIDWMMDLPPELEDEFEDQLHRFEEERQMPYITSVERRALERGRQEGRQEGRLEGEVSGLQEGIELALELKFGADGLALMPAVREVRKPELLRSIRQTLRTAETLEPVRALLSETD